MSMEENAGPTGPDLARLSADIVAAYVRNNPLSQDDVGELVKTVHATLSQVSANGSAPSESGPGAPAVPISESVTPDYIVCLDDGQKFKTLKRHLWEKYGLTPEAYRQRWNLPADYPMVAPNYSAKRTRIAKDTGLGKPQG